jgi:hypothetical protein
VAAVIFGREQNRPAQSGPTTGSTFHTCPPHPLPNPTAAQPTSSSRCSSVEQLPCPFPCSSSPFAPRPRSRSISLSRHVAGLSSHASGNSALYLLHAAAVEGQGVGLVTSAGRAPPQPRREGAWGDRRREGEPRGRSRAAYLWSASSAFPFSLFIDTSKSARALHREK